MPPPRRSVGGKRPLPPDPPAGADTDTDAEPPVVIRTPLVRPPRAPRPAPSQPAPEEPAAPAGLAPLPEPPDPGDVEVAVRFDRPAPALGYLGQLTDGEAREPRVLRGESHWWVAAELPLALARELAELGGGRCHVPDGDRLLLDPGHGPGPDPRLADLVPAGSLTEVPVVELVRAAGLRARDGARPRQVHVLARRERAAALVRRGLDLGLGTSFRPVRAAPLFHAADGDGRQAGTLTEVRLEAVQRDTGLRAELPPSLLDALDRDRNVLACRAHGRLMVQARRWSPLPDHQLAAVLLPTVEAGVLVLADEPHGCWLLTPMTEFRNGWEIAQLDPANRLEPGDPALTGPADDSAVPETERIQVVRTRQTGDPVDAVLLRTGDLRLLRALFEGRPLAELAFVVHGGDRHLLIAPGGVRDRIPVGQYLVALSPAPSNAYVAHGWRTRPRLPAAAWHALYEGIRDRALVLEENRTLVFDLTTRRPVWELWAGDLPEFDEGVPDGVPDELARMDASDPVAAAVPARGAPRRPSVPSGGGGGVAAASENVFQRGRRMLRRLRGREVDWREAAMDAEAAGDFEVAADLLERHGELERAAKLFELAAERKDPGP